MINIKKQKINQAEDKIFKVAMEFFAERGLEFLGIKGKVKDIGYTEEIKLDIMDLRMDYNFLMENDDYIHLEFQTTYNKNDIYRFLVYDSLLTNKTKRNVTTYVVYTNKIKNTDKILKLGSISYEIIPIYISTFNLDIKNLMNKKVFQNDDFLNIAFLPLMEGGNNIKEKLEVSIDLSKKIDEKTTAIQIQSILYVFANKFLNYKDLEDIKEMIKMTALGELIYDDGVKKGKAEGKLEEQKAIIKKLLIKGKSVSFIAQELEYDLALVEEVKKSLESSN